MCRFEWIAFAAQGFNYSPPPWSLQRGGGKNLQVPVHLLPKHRCVTVGAQVVPKVVPVSWSLSHVLSFMLARTWKLLSQLPTPYSPNTNCFSLWVWEWNSVEGNPCFLWSEILLLLPHLQHPKAILRWRTGKCFILSLLVYGLWKKARPWIWYFYVYFVKVISVQIYRKILLIPSVGFFCL